MGDWFLGEIRIFPVAWAPQGWMLCDGRSLNIQQYVALSSLLGNTYGGNGTTTFNIPDLRGRVMVGAGTNIKDYIQYLRGAAGGAEKVTLTPAQIPPHNHNLQVLKEIGAVPNPTNNFFATAGVNTTVTVAPNLYGAPSADAKTPMIPLNPATLSPGGAAAGHDNVQPSLVLNYCIAYIGTYPSRN